MCPSPDLPHGQPVKLRAFIEGLLADFEASARARHVALDALVFSDDLHADAELLRRLLTDLLGGALRRAPVGTNVSLVVSPRQRYTEFRIADEGAGVTLQTRGLQEGAGELSGDGAGLTVCMLAAEAHGGRLSVTETDSGSVVCLALPSRVGLDASKQSRVDGASPRGPVKAEPELDHSESGIYTQAAATKQTVLVVDDEPLVRAYVLRALKDTGYGVLEAGCAEGAMEVLKSNQQPIDLLLSDVGLPGVSGAELARQARLLRPELPTLLMSASAKRALVRDGVLDGGTYLLQKPFAVAELLAKLEELLLPPSRRMASR